MISETDWEVFDKNYCEAMGYHYRAEQFLQEGQRPSLIFNVASIALERYLIALCSLYGKMPFNHNYSCLIDTVVSVISFPSDLIDEIISLDKIFGICSLDNYYHGVPVPEDSTRVLLMCKEVRELFNQPPIASKMKTAEKIKKELL